MKFLQYIMLATAVSASAQTVLFEEDNLHRGYYDRPWQRYEAEEGVCQTNGTFLTPLDNYTQQPLQAEASNESATILSSKGDYVEWSVDKAGRGLTLRFSLPDSPDGTGLKGNLLLAVDGKEVRTIVLDSKWAWQYTQIAYQQEKYPDNKPADSKFARMRFDEVYLLLDEDIPSGATMRLTKADDNNTDYCIDFVELEPVAAPVAFEDLTEPNKVRFDNSTSLSSFISSNPGKTIYIPAGTYDLPRQLNISSPGTKIIGAGMWHTHLYFSTPSDSRNTYNARGIHCYVSDVVLQGMSINTANDKRYYDNNPSYQVGKGLNGSWGSNSTVRDVRIDHFECGGWITGAQNLRIEHCRFRNNYADGINLANNSSNCTVTHCSFRNNGDDDMASWSTGSFASDNEYSYCTAENNWRASSLGFFGGQRNKAHHIAIYDAMEAGARVVCDFDGTGFSKDGYIEFADITIRNCGAKQGTSGTQGGFWGDSAAAFQIGAGWAYDLNNVRIQNVDIYNSRFDAISIKSNSGKTVNNLELDNINIIGVEGYAYGVNIDPAVRGNGSYSNIHAEGVVEPYMSDIPSNFHFKGTSGIEDVITREDTQSSIFFDLNGRIVPKPTKRGIYIVKEGNERRIIFLR
ncbi:MAG: right-handed parallel beta-helix repeat-containing protein [Bacteroides sp.]|nr:right-handed parallel beta-helix repeat-containing protein [Bacteroides sp.]MCM1457961.1 right-handed parallel beta-helix repeat-containing protein [Lachnoclostridium sp.]